MCERRPEGPAASKKRGSSNEKASGFCNRRNHCCHCRRRRTATRTTERDGRRRRDGWQLSARGEDRSGQQRQDRRTAGSRESRSVRYEQLEVRSRVERAAGLEDLESGEAEADGWTEGDG